MLIKSNTNVGVASLCHTAYASIGHGLHGQNIDGLHTNMHMVALGKQEPKLELSQSLVLVVPLTPDDHGGVNVVNVVRRSPREHKKPKPCFEVASSSLPVLKAKQGLRVF